MTDDRTGEPGASPTGGPAEAAGNVEDEERERMLSMLREAAEELGASPTIAEFNALDWETSADTIKRAFGTWNDAKRAAGLATRQRGTVVPIAEDYFASIDSRPCAYWFGTLFAHSSLQPQQKSDNYMLRVGRCESKAHFVRGFASAVDSEYPIGTHEPSDPSTEEPVLHLSISNPTFVWTLVEAGYPAPDDEATDFPSLGEEYRPAFVRGYLESGGYFSTQGWQIRVDGEDRASTLQSWFEDFGAERPTTSNTSSSGWTVRVSNVFDVRAVFETCWPQQVETDPSWRPYPEQVIEYLEAEYPYPDKVPYLTAQE